jgi:hypothetical protein
MGKNARQQYEFAVMWNWWVEIKASYARTGTLSDVEKRSLLDLNRWAEEENLSAVKSSVVNMLRENGVTKLVGPYFESNVKSSRNEEDVRTEIVDAMARRANEVGAAWEKAHSSRRTVIQNQLKYIKHGKGELYPHPRDKVAWEGRDRRAKVHTFLPGYATGDRYTAILTMLIDEHLCLVIAYEQGDDKEQEQDRKNALSAFDTVVAALTANDVDPSGRVCLLSHRGSLREARETLNTREGRRAYTHVRGYEPPLLHEDSKEHVYHISITTVVMAEAWGDDYSRGRTVKEKSGVIRACIHRMIPEGTRSTIDGIVRARIGELSVKSGSVAIWIANRPKANPREAEAISNPYMFEQIRYAIEATGRPCFHIADGFVNVVEETKEDRHRFKPGNLVDVGKFWDDSSGLLKARENQWYFLDQLFIRTECHTIIGIRSGALEPIALLGHNVIYLEHSDMFTPERHGAWQGRIPYSRLVTCNRTGYYDKDHPRIADHAIGGHVVQSEVARDQAIRSLISRNLEQKQGRVATDHALNMAQQDNIASVTALIEEGVLLPSELELLLELLKLKLPAFRVL